MQRKAPKEEPHPFRASTSSSARGKPVVHCFLCDFYGDNDAVNYHINTAHFGDGDSKDSINERRMENQDPVIKTDPDGRDHKPRASLHNDDDHPSKDVNISNAHSRPIHVGESSHTNCVGVVLRTASHSNSGSRPKLPDLTASIIPRRGPNSCRIGAAEILNKLLAREPKTNDWLKNKDRDQEKLLKTNDAMAQQVLDTLKQRDPGKFIPEINNIINEYKVHHHQLTNATVRSTKKRRRNPQSSQSKSVMVSSVNRVSTTSPLQPDCGTISNHEDVARRMTIDVDENVDEDDDLQLLIEHQPKVRIVGATIGNVFVPKRHWEDEKPTFGQHLCFDDSDFSNLSPEELRYRDRCKIQQMARGLGTNSNSNTNFGTNTNSNIDSNSNANNVSIPSYHRSTTSSTIPSLCDSSPLSSTSNVSLTECQDPHSRNQQLYEAMSDLARHGPSVTSFMSDIKWAEPDTECHNVLRSSLVDRIRTHILKLPQYAKRKKAFLIEVNKYDDDQFKPSRKELSLIELYINRNHEGNTSPSIRPQSGQNSIWMKIDKVVGIRKMAPCPWGSFLDGDLEAFAKTQIDAGCILGQYVGVEVTKEEWNNLFNGTREECENHKYLGGDTVRVPMTLRYNSDIGGDDQFDDTNHGIGGGNDTKNVLMERQFVCDHCGKEFKSGSALGGHVSGAHRNKMGSENIKSENEKFEAKPPKRKRRRTARNEKRESGSNDESSGDDMVDHEVMDEVVELAFDPMMAKSKSPLMRINDCRSNIYNKELTAKDKRRINCEMISVLVNGWPTTLIRTTKRVLRDQPLLFYYGKSYSKVLEEVDLMEHARAKRIRAHEQILLKHS